ncbi:MAG: peptidase S8 and S53 subtilisin kexin sedolisin, partial [Bacteroidetes bacterium]|nr:peptidase S8 and S53 subtilisin kexin sedolisin [Bacteroidota bacterium]
MSQLKIRSGNSELSLRKSKSFVGLRTKAEAAEQQDYVESEVHENLGGFKIVSLKEAENDIDQKLDEVRRREEVEIGTHVYYAEGSDKPLVATGEIFITFADLVSEEEQQIVLAEYSLELVER